MADIDRIFAAWPSAAALARDIGVSEITVRQWKNRSGSIPVRYWPLIRSKGDERGAELPLEIFLPQEAFDLVNGADCKAAAGTAPQ